MPNKLMFCLGSFRLQSISPAPAISSSSAGFRSFGLWQALATHLCPDPTLAHELLELVASYVKSL